MLDSDQGPRGKILGVNSWLEMRQRVYSALLWRATVWFVPCNGILSVLHNFYKILDLSLSSSQPKFVKS